MLRTYRNILEPQLLVEAAQLSENNAKLLENLTNGVLVQEIDPFDSSNKTPGINVPTRRGMKRASMGDYIIRSADKFFVRSAEEFEYRWEPVNGERP